MVLYLDPWGPFEKFERTLQEMDSDVLVVGNSPFLGGDWRELTLGIFRSLMMRGECCGEFE
jgi:hypothetical protein